MPTKLEKKESKTKYLSMYCNINEDSINLVVNYPVGVQMMP